MIEHASGGPGTPPTWTSSAKDMVECALGISRLWFTLGFGIVNEVNYPRVDIPQIRDLGFIIDDGEGFWAEVKRVANYRIRLLAPGVPAVEIVHRHERYSLRLRIAPDARRDVLAIECRLDADPKLRVYVLLAPHLGATGYGNRAAILRYRRRRTCGPSKGRSAPPWRRLTKSSVMPSAEPAPAMSAIATAGRTSPGTAQ
jgi:glucoamylase